MKPIKLLLAIIALFFLGFILLFVQSLFTNNFSFSLQGDFDESISALFTKIVTASGAIYWSAIYFFVLVLLSIGLIIKRGQKLMILLFLIWSLVLFALTIYATYSDSRAFKNLLKRAEYTISSPIELSFRKEVGLNGNSRVIRFKVDENIDNVLAYYKSNLGPSRSLEIPDIKATRDTIVSYNTDRNETLSEYSTAQLRVIVAGSRFSFNYRIDLRSKYGTNETNVTLTGTSHLSTY